MEYSAPMPPISRARCACPVEQVVAVHEQRPDALWLRVDEVRGDVHLGVPEHVAPVVVAGHAAGADAAVVVLRVALPQVVHGQPNGLLVGDAAFDFDVGNAPVTRPEVGLFAKQRVEAVGQVADDPGHGRRQQVPQRRFDAGVEACEFVEGDDRVLRGLDGESVDELLAEILGIRPRRLPGRVETVNEGHRRAGVGRLRPIDKVPDLADRPVFDDGDAVLLEFSAASLALDHALQADRPVEIERGDLVPDDRAVAAGHADDAGGADAYPLARRALPDETSASRCPASCPVRGGSR